MILPHLAGERLRIGGEAPGQGHVGDRGRRDHRSHVTSHRDEPGVERGVERDEPGVERGGERDEPGVEPGGEAQ